MPELLVTQAGLRTMIQDLGRPGNARFGLAPSGAADLYSARVANALACNHEKAPLIEIFGADFSCQTTEGSLIAVTGAGATLTVDGHPRPLWSPHFIAAGQQVKIGAIHNGLRMYLALHGGLTAPQLMGSVAPDRTLGFGTALTPGDVVALRCAVPDIDHPYSRIPLLRPHVAVPRRGYRLELTLTDGPDRSEFPGMDEELFGPPFEVDNRSDEVGVRLAGPTIHQFAPREHVSRAVPVGAVEVPNSHEVIVLHRAKPATAGYAIPAVATAGSLDALAQVRPGDIVHFRRVTLAEAQGEWSMREADVTRLRSAVAELFRWVAPDLVRCRERPDQVSA